jgi:hypothetical protein
MQIQPTSTAKVANSEVLTAEQVQIAPAVGQTLLGSLEALDARARDAGTSLVKMLTMFAKQQLGVDLR